jgi:hypothetical protein
MVECDGLIGYWKSCPSTSGGLQPFEVQAFALVGMALGAALLMVVALTVILVFWSLLRD